MDAGNRCVIRQKKLAQIRALYPFLDADTSYKVAKVEDDDGRQRVYIEVPGRADWVCLWGNQVNWRAKA